MNVFFKRVTASALALTLLFTTGCSSQPPADTASGAPAVSAAVYPEMAPYPDESKYINKKTGIFDSEGFDEVYTTWRKDQQARFQQPEGFTNGLADFFRESIPVFLDADTANPVCSPLNIYMALSLLAETTDGNSRQQILDAIGVKNQESLRVQAGQVWNAHYCNDGATSTILANSVWLDEGLEYSEDTIRTLTECYFASVFQGDLGSSEMNRALGNWLNEQTGGLLEEQAQNVQLDPQTVLALAPTIFYQAKWGSEFWKEQNTEGLFHTPSGDRNVTYMNKQLSYGPYYWGEDFAAASLSLEDSSQMWLILPDEGKSPQDLLSSGHALDMILNHTTDYENQKRIKVNLSLPKFDVVSDLQLDSAVKQLGITEVFDPDAADFSGILPSSPAWLDKVQHAARVTIDEEGVSAAAYTVMAMAGAAMPPEDEVDLVLDRPFLFVITSRYDLPLFAGIVNTP